MSEWELTSDWVKERIDADPPEGTPSWLELSVPDPDRAREFYGTLFGWTFEDDLCLLDGLPVAAIRLLGEGPGEPDGPEWTVFFATDDCDRTVERVSAAGGRILREPHEVEGRGRAALVADVLGRVSACGRAVNSSGHAWSTATTRSSSTSCTPPNRTVPWPSTRRSSATATVTAI
ncbi:VOC family protein [Actinocorallia sp. B10E7]|uniref:VOC family protein n=1 Tax=Actinocorallia sp. B10E7 TaxID=3153558 RepID=UPI00325F4D7F